MLAEGLQLSYGRRVPCLTIEREPERGIEVERCALLLRFLPRLRASGRAGVVEVRSDQGHDGRAGSTERERGPRKAGRAVGVSPCRCDFGEAQDRVGAEPPHPEPSCDRSRLLEVRERLLEVTFEQFDPPETGQRSARSTGVVDEPSELERLVQPAARLGGVPAHQG
jgi:hypothetical protein